jgi:hypothetical protein
MDRLVRSSPHRPQLVVLSCGLAAAVVAVAVAFAVAGVDQVEVLATLLFAPVAAAALLGGRSVGYVVAGLAAAGYLALRLDDMDGAVLGVGLLIVARAACYVATAHFAPLLAERIAPLVPAPAARLRPPVVEPLTEPGLLEPGNEPVPVPVGAGWFDQRAEPPPEAPLGQPWQPSDEAPSSVEAWASPRAETFGPVEDLVPEPAAQPLVTAWTDPPPPDLPPPALSDEGMSAYAELDSEGPPHRLDEPTAGGWDQPPRVEAGPPAPTIPTGWVDDATIPLGDESIPVGYTGELFLPRDIRQQPLDNRSPWDGPGNGHADPARLNGHQAGDDLLGAQPAPHQGASAAPDPAGGGAGPGIPVQPRPPASEPRPAAASARSSGSDGIDPETRLWTARAFRDRLTQAREEALRTGMPFSVVMIQVPDAPFQPLPYRRQVAVLRELGHQFVHAQVVDHLVHLPDGAKHWFAVVLPGTDRAGGHMLERRLRSAIAGYLRSRGLRVGEVLSASLTSPDDDEAMNTVWSSLFGSASGVH